MSNVLDTIENRRWERLSSLLHPEVHWTTAAEEDLHGPAEVIARLSSDPPPAPPSFHEVRDGLVYRWIDCPGGARDVITVWCYHDVMAKNLTVRLDSELAADAEAIARADGTSLNETIKQALSEAVERRRRDPKFKARLRRIIEEDRELLERLAK